MLIRKLVRCSAEPCSSTYGRTCSTSLAYVWVSLSQYRIPIRACCTASHAVSHGNSGGSDAGPSSCSARSHWASPSAYRWAPSSASHQRSEEHTSELQSRRDLVC